MKRKEHRRRGLARETRPGGEAAANGGAPRAVVSGSEKQTSEEVQRILEKASYFVIFSVPDAQSLSQGIPLIPFIPESVYKINIVEVLESNI